MSDLIRDLMKFFPFDVTSHPNQITEAHTIEAHTFQFTNRSGIILKNSCIAWISNSIPFVFVEFMHSLD